MLLIMWKVLDNELTLRVPRRCYKDCFAGPQSLFEVVASILNKKYTIKVKNISYLEAKILKCNDEVICIICIIQF